MAYDRDEGFFHLTATGWRRQDIEPYPEGRIETWLFKSSQTSGWSSEQVSMVAVWAAKNIPRADRDALRDKFPMPGIEPGNRDHTVSSPL